MLLRVLADTIAGNFDRKLDKEFRRRVEELVIIERAELIRRNIDKYGFSSANLIQQVNCMETTKVDIAECCTVDLGCDITRTLDKVPQPIRIRNRSSNFLYVGTIDGKKSYSYSTIEEKGLLNSERFALKDSATYDYINGYLYIYGDDPEHIRVKGIFNDPREVENLNDCVNPNEDCIENIEISGDLASNIINLVSDKLRGTRLEPEQEEIKLADESIVN